MDNATDDCHKMFQSLVPKIGSTDNFDIFAGKTSSECKHQLVSPLEPRGSYSATSNYMKLVHWPLMGGLLHLVE